MGLLPANGLYWRKHGQLIRPTASDFFLGRATRDYSLSSRNLSKILKVNFHYVEVYLSLFNNKILLIFCVWDTFPWYNLNLIICSLYF